MKEIAKRLAKWILSLSSLSACDDGAEQTYVLHLLHSEQDAKLQNQDQSNRTLVTKASKT